MPYQWQTQPELARYEAWCAGMLYACFRAIGADLRVEESSSHGRSDMVPLHGSQVFVLEFKMAEEGDDAETAASQFICWPLSSVARNAIYSRCGVNPTEPPAIGQVGEPALSAMCCPRNRTAPFFVALNKLASGDHCSNLLQIALDTKLVLER